MGGVAFDGHGAEAEGQVVAVRADEVDAALGFLLTNECKRCEQTLGLRVHVGEVGAGRVIGIRTDDAVDRSVEGEAQVARRIGDVVIGARGRLSERSRNGRSRSRDARGQGGELLIPHL